MCSWDIYAENGPFAFLCPAWGGGLGTTYDVHRRLIGRPVVDFLSVIIELVSPGITAEAVRAK